jgi:hypothetical protein
MRENRPQGTLRTVPVGAEKTLRGQSRTANRSRLNPEQEDRFDHEVEGIDAIDGAADHWF